MNDQKLIVGIDGGGTNTKCILFDEFGKTLDIVNDKGSNLYVFKELGVKIILNTISEILNRNNLDYEDISVFGIGLAGISDIFQRELLLKELDKVNISNKSLIMSDIESAYKILCPADTGILINIGTGIICFSKQNKEIVKVAGKGHDKGDVGSGYWLGKELFSKLILNENIIPFDCELSKIFEIAKKEFNKSNLEEIYKLIEDGNDIYCHLSALGKYVVNLAEEGNDISLSIVQEGTRQIAEYIIELIELISYKNKKLVLAANGSIIKNKFYRKQLNNSLIFNFESINWIMSDLSPAYGAGIIAGRYKNIDIDISKIVSNIN